jgi:hypothetical protein
MAEEELKDTKCKGCGTHKRPIFVRPNARSADDFWCKPCMDQGKHLDKGK